MVYIGYMGGNTAARNQRTQSMDTELYAELVDRLTEADAIIGGGETLDELQEMLEEIEGEAAYESFTAGFYSY